MGRIVLADDRIQTYVNNLYDRGQWFIGLIVGQVTAQKDYAVHIVRTPEPVEDQVSDDDEEEKEVKKKKKRRKSQCKPETLDAVNEQWAATHLKQVTTMLPGGLEVIGIFALAPPTMMQNSQVKLRQILFTIHKKMMKMSVNPAHTGPTDRLLLQICSTTRKLSCRSIDVSDPKSTFRPAEWKFQTSPFSWHRLETSVTLDLSVDVPIRSQNSGTLRQIQAAIQPFCDKVWTGLLTFSGQLRDGRETLDQSADSKKGKGKDRGQPAQIYSVNLILNKSDTDEASEAVVEEVASVVLVKGTVYGRAFVTTRATVSQAEQALKTDLVRSVMCRSELLCDDIDMVEEDSVSRELYDTPVRVFYPLPGTSLTLCDYIFQDEKVEEVVLRISELLDITVTEEDLDFSCERVATQEDCGLSPIVDPSDESAGVDIKDVGRGFKYFIVAGLAGATAMLMAGLSYLISEER